MAITNTAVQIKWAGANTVSVAAAGAQESDVYTPDQTAIDALLQVKADNAGTPAAGDTIDVYVLYTTGDPDADPDVADEFDTASHAQWLMKLDTSSEDPAIKSVPLNVTCKALKIRVVSNAGANSITVSAQVTEKRG